MITSLDLDDVDEDGAAARERFEDLQAKAYAVGLTLTRSSKGFLLVERTVIRHANDLETIATMLKRRST